jgi:hypothetical protein
MREGFALCFSFQLILEDRDILFWDRNEFNFAIKLLSMP